MNATTNIIVWIVCIAGVAVFIGGVIAFFKLERSDAIEHKAKLKRRKIRM